MALDEKLTELTEQNAQLSAEVVRLKEEIDNLQIEYSTKLANAKVDFETRELGYKKQIKELTLTLELRNSNERAQLKKSDKKSVNAIWEEITGETK